MAMLLFSTGVITDDATFRAAGKAQSDAIVAMGLVRTADTGQINWATVARPAANTSAGYEMFAFADALQATAPVLIKIIWGCGLVNDRLRHIVQVGVGTNGAGAFLGWVTTARTLSMSSVLDAGNVNRISGATNRVCIAFNVHLNGATNCNVISVERTHNAAGGDTAQGVLVFYKDSNVGCPGSLLTFAGGELDAHAYYAVGLAPSVGHGSTGTQTMAFPVFFAAGPFFNPSLNVLGMFPGNITVGVPLTITLLGSGRQYIPLTTTGFQMFFYTTTSLALLMRND